MSDIGTPTHSSTTCPICGATNDAAEAVCRSCGHAFDATGTGAAPLTPVEAHADRFEPGAPGTLQDLGPLLDAEGDDIRHYTGEPVETEDGWVIPQQQNFAGSARHQRG